MINWDKFKSAAIEQLDKPYHYGGKWPLGDPEPKGPIDCSGFVRWAYSRVGIYLADGSAEQFLECHKVEIPALGDLGFFKNEHGQVHHVGILLDDKKVIEARGDPYNKVILRPRDKWEAWKEFTGWLRPDKVSEAELA